MILQEHICVFADISLCDSFILCVLKKKGRESSFANIFVDFLRMLLIVCVCLLCMPPSVHCVCMFLCVCHVALSHPVPAETTGKDSLTGFSENRQLSQACQCYATNPFTLEHVCARANI